MSEIITITSRARNLGYGSTATRHDDRLDDVTFPTVIGGPITIE